MCETVQKSRIGLNYIIEQLCLASFKHGSNNELAWKCKTMKHVNLKTPHIRINVTLGFDDDLSYGGKERLSTSGKGRILDLKLMNLT